VLRLERLARQAVLANERRRLCRRGRALGADEALDQTGQAVGLAAADDPLEQSAVLRRDVENDANWNRWVPVRATCDSAASAALRVTSSPTPAAIASANSAGSFFGARPPRDTATISATARRPSSWSAASRAWAFSRVNVHSDA
jgi:hypothetical protein